MPLVLGRRSQSDSFEEFDPAGHRTAPKFDTLWIGPAQDYIRYIEEIANVPVGWVSVGPERSQLITLT
jgi:adenylosuccinate synthase